MQDEVKFSVDSTPDKDRNGNIKLGTDCITVKENGTLAYRLKLENVIRCTVELPAKPENTITASSLSTALFDIAGLARKVGYQEIILESKSQELTNLLTELGLEAVKHSFKVSI